MEERSLGVASVFLGSPTREPTRGQGWGAWVPGAPIPAGPPPQPSVAFLVWKTQPVGVLVRAAGQVRKDSPGPPCTGGSPRSERARASITVCGGVCVSLAGCLVSLSLSGGLGSPRAGEAGEPGWGHCDCAPAVLLRESGNSSWEIPRASTAEEGTYECVAVSRAGTGRARAQIVVTGL